MIGRAFHLIKYNDLVVTFIAVMCAVGLILQFGAPWGW